MKSIIIGRNTEKQPEAADISVDDEYVSNRHARVTLDDDGRMWVEDLGALNGTFINGARVYGRSLLRPGDRLRVGRTEVQIPADWLP